MHSRFWFELWLGLKSGFGSHYCRGRASIRRFITGSGRTAGDDDDVTVSFMTSLQSADLGMWDKSLSTDLTSGVVGTLA